MSWEAIVGAISALAALGLAIFKGWYWWKGQKDAQHEALMKSAEAVADASKRVTDEARKTARTVEGLGPDTPCADGSKLLSGGE